MTTAAIYVRISDDRVGDAAGIQRQEADCRARCEQLGWNVGDVYRDNDCSAYSGKPRPEYRRMLADVKAGTIDAVIVWHLDRLTRRPAELETFFELCDSAGIRDLASCTGDVDLSTHDGRFMARILGAVARKESDDKSRRTRRKHLELAQQGRAVGSGRPFGYNDDRVTIRASEADLIRAAAARVLAGDSMRAIAIEWAAAEIPTPKGGRWTGKAIQRVLASPRIIGKRALGTAIVADAEWPAILDEVTQARLVAIFVSRASGPGSRARSYLLTGFLRCGKCTAPLVARPAGKDGHRRTYVCPVDPGKPGCGGIKIVAEPAEVHVLDRVRARLASPAFARSIVDQVHPNDAGILAEISGDEAALAQLATDHYVDRRISRAQFLAASQRLEERVSAARRRLARTQQRAIVVPFAGRVVDDTEWGALSFDRRRGLIAELVETITVIPAVGPRGTFDPARVKIRWAR